MLTHERIGSLDDLTRVEAQWEDVLARSRRREVTCSPRWLVAWWRVFGDLGGRRLSVVAFRRDGRLVGLAPFLCRTTRALRRLELLGSGEPQRDEICSEYLGLPCAAGEELAVVDALVGLLHSGAVGAWDELVLPFLSGEDPMVPLLLEGFRSLGAASVETTGGAPFVRLPRTFGDYLQSLPASRRQRARRALRTFEQWTEGSYVLKRAAVAGDVPVGLDVLERLHEARWAGAGRTGAFASRRFRSFHRAIAPELHARGELDLSWILVADRPVVAQYSLIAGSRVQFYQGGRSLEVPPSVRLGVVLHLLNIRRAIEEGREEYDFLSGSRPYKLELSNEVRPMLRLHVFRSSARTRVARAVQGAGRWARWVRDGVRQLTREDVR